jgi:hypothetical protein
MEIYYIDNDTRIEIVDRSAGIILDAQPLTAELLAQVRAQLAAINEQQRMYAYLPPPEVGRMEQHEPPKPNRRPHEITVMRWLREERNRLLAESDWTQMPDAPLDERTRQAWREYRQALRDLPQRLLKLPDGIYGREDIYKIEFPQKPAQQNPR